MKSDLVSTTIHNDAVSIECVLVGDKQPLTSVKEEAGAVKDLYTNGRHCYRGGVRGGVGGWVGVGHVGVSVVCIFWWVQCF